MSLIDSCMEKWNAFTVKIQPGVKKTREISKKAFDKTVYAWNYVSKFRKIFLAAPVAVFAVVIAIYNMIQLPAVVGLGLQADGDYSFQIIREVAVLGPLVITSICLLLMFISKRTLTPWMVSLLSLALPLVILVTNTFYR